MSGEDDEKVRRREGGFSVKRRHSRRYTTLTIALRTGPKAPQHGLKRRNLPKPLPAAKIAAESAYWLFGVNFDMRKSMSSPTP